MTKPNIDMTPDAGCAGLADLPEDKILEEFEEAEHEHLSQRLRLGLIVGMVFFPIFSVLDWFVYQNIFNLALPIRITFEFVLLSCLWLLKYIEHSKIMVKALGVFIALIVAFSINLIIFLADGAASSYYSGLVLVLVIVSLVLPWRIQEAILVSVSVIIMYLGACVGNYYLAHEEAFPYVGLVNGMFFLVSTAIVGIISSHIQLQQRYSQFRLNYELDVRNRELAQLDRLKSQFFANVSHELRTPLTLILGPVEDLLCRPRSLPDDVASMLGTIRSNALRLLKLVNDLLEVIRLEEAVTELRHEPVILDGLIGGIIDSMQHLADMQQVDLERDLKVAELPVLGDAGALEKVFINIIGNALKFTPEGGRVTVSSALCDDYIQIRVVDTGIGISQEDLPYIFDRFRQADGSSTRRHQGTGLGLTLVRDLTERHGGMIRVHSEVGRGTTMVIELPVASSEQLQEFEVEDDQGEIFEVQGVQRLHRAADVSGGFSADEPELIQEPVLRSGEQYSVLVVDDEPDMRRYLVDLLSGEYQVLQARNGLEGLQEAEENIPTAMVLDLMLPELDGLEVCRRLKSNPKTRHIKIILLTARVDESSKLTALEHGADDFLTKPFSSLEVRTRLRNLITTADLEQDLVVRNQDLESAMSELRQAQTQLIHSEKLNALGKMAAGLLHEINNPLNYTLTALQLMQADEEVTKDADLKEILDDMGEGLGRVRGIVTDLRAFAYPEKAESHVVFVVAEAIETALRFTASELSLVNLQEDVPTSLTAVGSRSHIVQVLVNLISNAARAVADEEKAMVAVRAREKDGRITVSVEDNGIGMDEEVRQRIFDPFYTTRDVGEGMGLGLSICHTIINNHGGTIRVDSELGKGTIFSFDLASNDAQAMMS